MALDVGQLVDITRVKIIFLSRLRVDSLPVQDNVVIWPKRVTSIAKGTSYSDIIEVDV